MSEEKDSSIKKDYKISKEDDFNPSKGYLALPFDHDQFKEFLKGLLGTPQTIQKKIKGTFEIYLSDLQNIHYLINQRVTQQNKGSLIQLKTQIYYSDESSVILSTFDELLSYNEIKPVISEAVKMTWSYLIQFNDKNVPEKQEIQILIISTPQSNIIEDDDIPTYLPIHGQIGIEIKHTARSWGSDIESLITNNLKNYLKSTKKIDKFRNKWSIQIGVIIGFLFLLISIIGLYINTSTNVENELKKVENFLSKNINLNDKLDYMLTFIINYNQNLIFLNSASFIIISIVFSIIITIWVSTLAENIPKSFLILTKKAKENHEEQIKKSERKAVKFWFSLIFPIICGIISNYIYALLNASN